MDDEDSIVTALGCLGPLGGLLAPEIQRYQKHLKGKTAMLMFVCIELEQFMYSSNPSHFPAASVTHSYYRPANCKRLCTNPVSDTALWIVFDSQGPFGASAILLKT